METPEHILNYTFNSHVVDGVIQQELLLKGQQISKWVIDTRQATVRDHLIKLGWTPPKNDKKRKTEQQRADFTKFVDGWAAAYAAVVKLPYVFQQSDFRSVYSLLKTGLTVQELLNLAERAWSDKFRAGQAGSILKFYMNFSSLQMALRQTGPEAREVQETIIVPNKKIGGAA